MNRTGKCYVTGAVALGLIISCSGCGQVQDALNKFDKAISEVQSLRESVTRESGNWREQLEKSQLQLTNDVKSTLNVDLRDNIDKSIAEAGIEARCDVDFANNHLVSYLQGVVNALQNKRDQIKKDGLWAGFTTPETAIADVIRNVGHLDPFICHAIPSRLAVSYKTETPAIKSADRTTVEFVGYALKRSSGEPKNLSLYVFGPTRGKAGKEMPNASDLMAVTTSYKVTIESSRLLSQLDLTDTKIALKWGEDTLSEVLLGTSEVKPPYVPKITDVILHVGTTYDDKDVEIYFDYTIHRRSDGKQVGGIQVGKGQLWDDPRNRKPDWRSFTISINPSDRFTEADRLGYRLHVKYNSTKGDPNWNGRFRADAVVEGGKVIPLMAETPDMDWPKKLKDSDFDFNK